MTLMALPERIGRFLSEQADEVQMEREGARVTCNAVIGKQAFVVTVEELPKDDQQPAIA